MRNKHKRMETITIHGLARRSASLETCRRAAYGSNCGNKRGSRRRRFSSYREAEQEAARAVQVGIIFAILIQY